MSQFILTYRRSNYTLLDIFRNSLDSKNFTQNLAFGSVRFGDTKSTKQNKLKYFYLKKFVVDILQKIVEIESFNLFCIFFARARGIIINLMSAKEKMQHNFIHTSQHHHHHHHIKSIYIEQWILIFVVVFCDSFVSTWSLPIHIQFRYKMASFPQHKKFLIFIRLFYLPKRKKKKRKSTKMKWNESQKRKYTQITFGPNEKKKKIAFSW